MADPRQALRAPFRPQGPAPPVEWLVSPGLTGYAEALAGMEALADAIAAGRARERVWLLEHPPLYTAGTSAREGDLLDPRFPVHRVGRGGQFTYHGPGQRVAYVMLDLKRRRPDVRAYVAALEGWLIAALASLGVEGETPRIGSASGSQGPRSRPGRAGRRPRTRSPRSASGSGAGRRFTEWRSTSPRTFPTFPVVVPCGIPHPRYGVTSLADLGRAATLAMADAALRVAFEAWFGPTVTAGAAAALPASALDGAAAMAPDPPTLARRAFWPRAYTRRRLGSERAAALKTLDYALVGERLGFRPNGFFDPRFYRERVGLGACATRLLAHYLARPDGPDPSAEFDGAVDRRREPGLARDPSPSVPALSRGGSGERPAAAGRYRHGFRARRDPRPGAVDGGGRDARLRSEAARRRDEAAADP